MQLLTPGPIPSLLEQKLNRLASTLSKLIKHSFILTVTGRSSVATSFQQWCCFQCLGTEELRHWPQNPEVTSIGQRTKNNYHTTVHVLKVSHALVDYKTCASEGAACIHIAQGCYIIIPPQSKTKNPFLRIKDRIS